MLKNQSENSESSPSMSRRDLLAGAAGIAAMAIARTGWAGEDVKGVVKNGRINQSVCRWCYNKIPLEKFCGLCVQMGLKGIDLLEPNELAAAKNAGLVCTMLFSHSLTEGLAHTKNHDQCIAKLTTSIDAASEFGFPNVICFSGNRSGISEEDGIKNTVEGIKKVIGLAEQKKITLCMELLNSKVNHKDYMFDNMKFGVEVCKQVASDRLKILYDIYHAQIMEGDIIHTIQTHKQYIGHYHTAGVPGRNEIEDTQELYYPAIMNAILKTGFTGFVAHEFVPKAGDPLKSLARAIEICDV